MQVQSGDIASSSSVRVFSCRCCSDLKTKQADTLNVGKSHNSSRYRQLELPIRKEIFSRCRKDGVTSASHYAWCRRKVMPSTSLAVLSVSSHLDSPGGTGYAETKRS